ncbi:MAG: IPTL-CTERM sorting domain-containing protein [Lysobacterales bacterium]
MHFSTLLRPGAAIAAVAALSFASAAARAQALVDYTLPEYSGQSSGPTLPAPGQSLPAGVVIFDDFNRADGPLGPSWSVVNGSFAIVSNAADGSSLGRALYVGGVSSVVEMDIAFSGAGVDYVAAVLDQGAGSSNIFVKVQSNGGAAFDRFGCYTGNNNSGAPFGLGFGNLSANFTSAHMRVSVDAARTVTLELTNIDGGATTQTYVCTGAPAAEGTSVGMGGFAAGLATIDNFSSGVTAADLSLTLTDSPDPVNAGTSLTYVATATNNGPGDAQDVSINLPLPAVTTFVSVTPSAGGICTTPAVGASGTVSCTWAGATANAAARTTTVVVDVPPSATGSLSATGTVTTTSTDPDPMNDSATADTAIAVSADLSITLTDAPDPVTAGSNLTYTATVTNGGPSDAQDVSISLPLPAGTSFVSATPSAGGSCNAASPVVCTFAGATAPTGVRSATIVAAVAPATTGSLSATATAASTTPDPTPGDNTATATTTVNASADLSITLADAPDPVTAGTNLVYTATVTNAGPSDATGVTVTMPVPANTTFVSGSTTGGGSCAGSPIVCTFPTSIAPTTSQTATITVAVSASAPNGSSISATATVGSASPDPVAGNNSASTTTAVVAEANLQLTLSASSLEVLTNEPVTFTAVSLNLGPSDAQNLSITMTLTPDFRYSAHTATGATCTTPQVGTTGAITCTWAGATAVNASRTLQVVAYSNNQGATAVNASTVSDTSDPVTTNNVGNVSVQVGFAVEGIPTLNQYGLILLGLMLGLLGFVAVRRNS